MTYKNVLKNIKPFWLMGFILSLIIASFALLPKIALADSPTTGCYQHLNQVNSSTSFVLLENSECAGKPTTNGGTVDPTKHCYLEVFNTNNSIAWDPNCSSIDTNNIVQACSPNQSSNGDNTSANCTAGLNCQAPNDAGQVQSGECNNHFIQDYLNPIIDFIAAGVGIIITIVIVVSGIQYSTSGGNPNAAAAAKQRILNAIIAIVAFGLAFALLQWIVPGGVFHPGP